MLLIRSNQLLAVSLLLSLAACGDEKWDARSLDHEVRAELNGVALTVLVPDGLRETDRSERQIIFDPGHLDDPDDADGVWPTLTVAVSTGELPRDAGHVAIRDDAADIEALSPNHVRVRYDGESTLVEHHFRALPRSGRYLRCEVVVYGGLNGVSADHERRRRWIQRLCEAVRAE
jgi:hypothetical protein